MMMKLPEMAGYVHVTKHAQERLLQRCRLLLRECERQNPRHFIYDEFRKSYMDMSIEMSPGKKARLIQKHGEGAFISSTKDFVFAGIYISDRNEVVIKSIMYMPNSMYNPARGNRRTA